MVAAVPGRMIRGLDRLSSFPFPASTPLAIGDSWTTSAFQSASGRGILNSSGPR